MKLVNFKAPAPKAEVMRALYDDGVTNQNVEFKKLSGKPKMRIKEKGNRVRIKCELLREAGAKKDNGFIFGTAFYGKITEKNGVTKVCGLITTELIFHLVFLAMLVVFLVQCIYMNGFSVVPVCLVIADIFMFREEFRKQGIIKRYIARALRRAVFEFREAQKNDCSN
jgi:hypothetical protein